MRRRTPDSDTLAIYRGRKGYYVQTLNESREGLWCPLGPLYTRELAQKLADSLNEELNDARARR